MPNNLGFFTLAPAIAAIDDFTDRDETRYLPAELGALLLRFETDLAVRYVTTLLEDEKYADVEGTMREIVLHGNLAESAVNSLFSTCIQPSSIRSLEERASNGDLLADEMLRSLRGSFSVFLNGDSETACHTETMIDDTLDDGDLADPGWHLNFPPEILDQLVKRISSARPSTIACKLTSWLRLWSESGRATDALDAAESHYLSDDRLSVDNRMVMAVMRIGGKSRSYPWLVRAQQSNRGWMQYWSSFEETLDRWNMLKKNFPNKWDAFLIDSIRPFHGYSHSFSGSFAHLIEYLVHLDRTEDAQAATTQLAEAISGLVLGPRSTDSGLDNAQEGALNFRYLVRSLESESILSEGYLSRTVLCS